MREALAKIEGERRSYTGTFSRFGQKAGWKGRPETTVLLIDIHDAAGRKICDHLWFRCTKGFSELGMIAGARVAFDARSVPYWKGYGAPEEQERDFKLCFPTNLRIVTPAPVEELPLFSNEQNGKKTGLSRGLLEAFEARLAAEAGAAASH